MTVKIHGLRELSRKLEKLPRDVRGRTLDRATREGAKVIRDRAKNTYVPVRTGRLRESIVARKDREQSSDVFSTYTIGYLKKKAYYGGFVEVGTSRTPAQPYLRPAIETERENAIAKVAAVLKKALKL